jgi:hypothetical protein
MIRYFLLVCLFGALSIASPLAFAEADSCSEWLQQSMVVTGEGV